MDSIFQFSLEGTHISKFLSCDDNFVSTAVIINRIGPCRLVLAFWNYISQLAKQTYHLMTGIKT